MDGHEKDYDQVMNEALKMARPSRAPWVLLVLALAAGAAAAFYLLRMLDQVRTDSAARIAEAQDLLAKEAAARAKVDQERERLENENRALLVAKEDLSKNVQAKEEELAKLKGTYDELQEKMKGEIAKGEIQLSSVGGRLRVDLIDKVLFDSGEAQISKTGEEVLSRVGAILARIEDKQIQVSGHTDDAPISTRLAVQYPTNWELSSARAIHVVRFLQEKAGVPGRRLVASGYGPFQPISHNSRPSGRARNRRIEILLTPAFDPTPAKVAAVKPGAEPAKPPRPAPAKPAQKPKRPHRRR